MSLLLFFACSGNGSESADSSSGGDDECPAACDDLVASGIDVIGNWTMDFGSSYYDKDYDCTGQDFSEDVKGILGGTLEVRGRSPAPLYGILNDTEEFLLAGSENEHGGMVFAGAWESGGYDLRLAFGGLAFDDVYRNKTVIEGFGYAGVDLTGDGEIECGVRGDLTMLKSGS